MYLNIRTVRDGDRGSLASRAAPDALAVALFENTHRLPEGYRSLDTQIGGAISAVIGRREFTGAVGTVATAYPADRAGRSRRVYVLGLGSRQKPVADALRTSAAVLVRAAHSAGVKNLLLRLEPGLGDRLDDQRAGQAVGEGLGLAQFNFTQCKGTANKARQSADARLTLTVRIDPPMRRGLDAGLRLAQSVNLARTLAATPPNIANPAYLVAYCRNMARRVGLRCTILDARRARALNMGGLLAVGAGGSTPPAMIVLEHRPRHRNARTKPVLLVGKAVTFDTGGYSIKPAENMDRMKYDKCGGMAVIGAMHAIARLKLPVPVVGLIPVAENMIGEKAYRPGDILRLCNGVTVEVTNTDAEGRLILGDALAYGCKTYRPQAVIDLATLTGGVVVALGSFCAGCFCHDAQLRARLFDAADQTGERLWHLPLWDEHRQMLKGVHGDLVNAGPREAHPIQGAAFLSHFVGKDGDFVRWNEIPWAHLDIAGVADAKTDTPLFPKGPTGFGVRLLVRALQAWKS